MPVRPANGGEITMSAHPMPAKRMFKTGTIMCVLWLGAGIMLVWQAQGSEIISKGVAAASGKPFSFLEIHSNAHPDLLPAQ
jgi:hypothetical protein